MSVGPALEKLRGMLEREEFVAGAVLGSVLAEEGRDEVGVVPVGGGGGVGLEAHMVCEEDVPMAGGKVGFLDELEGVLERWRGNGVVPAGIGVRELSGYVVGCLKALGGVVGGRGAGA